MKHEALLVLDLQNDFITGSLRINGAKDIIKPINELIKKADVVITSADYHPHNHTSFAQFGGAWPPHCIEGTLGAELHKDLIKDSITSHVYKGRYKDTDIYSAFGAKSRGGLTLQKVLKKHHIKSLIVAGLALDVCVLYTVLDALKLGYKVTVYKDTVASVGDVEDTLRILRNKGVTIK